MTGRSSHRSFNVVDRGAATGVVLVGGDSIRLLEIRAGHIDEPDDSTYELSLGDWRPFKAYSSANPARGQQTVSHQEHYEARVEEQRGKLFVAAAEAAAERAEGLGWERIVIAAEGQVATRFQAALPEQLRRRVITTLDHNVGHEDSAAIVTLLEPHLEASWLKRTRQAIAGAHERAGAGGAGVIGPQETLGALAEGRVDHLILDPDHDFSSFAGSIPVSIGGPPSMLAERAVEAAIAAGGRVSTLPVSDSEGLLDADGMVALLRY